MINQKLKEHAIASIAAGVRRDGRGLLEYRPIKIETGLSSTAHGSAKVTSGDVIVFAGAKMEVGKPYADSPDEGSLMVSAELLPLSNSAYEAGPPSIDSIEVARVIDRCIRESKAMDLKALSIKHAESMWIVAVDLAPINANGSLFDVGALAALAAIKNTRKPSMSAENVPNYEKLTDERLDLTKYPILVTVYKMGNAYIVDPTQDEEQYCDARLSIATLDERTVCALQKGGSGPLTTKDVEVMVEIALKLGTELRAMVK